jgi:hypothetical protein
VFFVLLRSPIDRLEIGCWCLEDIFSTLPRTYLQSFTSIRIVLIEFWLVLLWFVLLFLDSAEPPWKTWNLRESLDRGASGGNAEPPHLYAENLCLGSPSAYFEIRLLHWSSSVLRIFFLSTLVTSWHGYFWLKTRFFSIVVEFSFSSLGLVLVLCFFVVSRCVSREPPPTSWVVDIMVFCLHIWWWFWDSSQLFSKEIFGSHSPDPLVVVFGASLSSWIYFFTRFSQWDRSVYGSEDSTSWATLQ